MTSYHNDLNTLMCEKLTKDENNVLMAIITKLGTGGETVTLTFREIKEIAWNSHRSEDDFVKAVRGALRKYITAAHEEEKENGDVTGKTIFRQFEIKRAEKLITISIEPSLTYLFNAKEGNYTSFELREYAGLKTDHAKTIYRFLKQWKKTGVWSVTAEDFRKYVKAPAYMRESDIDGRIIKPAVKELKGIFPGLEVEKIKERRRGAPVAGYMFRFSVEENEKHIGVCPACRKPMYKITKKDGSEYIGHKSLDKERCKNSYRDLEALKLDWEITKRAEEIRNKAQQPEEEEDDREQEIPQVKITYKVPHTREDYEEVLLMVEKDLEKDPANEEALEMKKLLEFMDRVIKD